MAPVEESTAVVAAQPEETVVEYWDQEPDTVEQLLDQYVVEAKFPAMLPGGTLYLTACADRKGEVKNALQNQRYKLWFANWFPFVNIFRYGVIGL